MGQFATSTTPEYLCTEYEGDELVNVTYRPNLISSNFSINACRRWNSDASFVEYAYPDISILFFLLTSNYCFLPKPRELDDDRVGDELLVDVDDLDDPKPDEDL